MSEWYDRKNKLSSSFRKLLQERIEEANPRRNLTAEETKRLAKLEAIVDKLKRGENVQNRQLQTWLSEDEHAQIEAEWQEQLELREELKDKPSDLKRYEDKLRAATVYYNRAEGYSRKGKHSTAKTFYNKSESFCEDALEILQEILHYDSTLRVWFDRDFSFEVGGDLSADIVSVPNSIRNIEALLLDEADAIGLQNLSTAEEKPSFQSLNRVDAVDQYEHLSHLLHIQKILRG